MPNLVQGSPSWWLARLEKQLDSCAKELQLFDAYYEGDHRLQFATPKFRSVFGDLFRAFADNWCDLVCDAVEERLNVEGFRFGQDTAGEKRAWRYWQANQLDADSQIAHTEALVNGRSFLLVWAGDDGEPQITVESPQQVTVAHTAGSRRLRAAALKRWVDDDEFEMATLYLPDEIYKYRSEKKLASGTLRTTTPNVARWRPREVDGEPWPLPNPLGVPPMVPLNNRPRLLRPGQSEIKRVIPLQDAVNKTVADMLVASEFGAAPQRWATGLELDVDPETKQAVKKFEHMIDRMWTSADENTKFGQFAQTELGVFVKAVEMFVQHIASQTRTPPHYFALTGQFPSGDAIKSAETGLVAKVRRKMRHFGEGWEEAIRLAFAVAGDTKRASFVGLETVWADPESRSEAQHVDAVTKLKTLGLPDEYLWEQAGLSPQEIERVKAMRAAEPPKPAQFVIAPSNGTDPTLPPSPSQPPVPQPVP